MWPISLSALCLNLYEVELRSLLVEGNDLPADIPTAIRSPSLIKLKSPIAFSVWRLIRLNSFSVVVTAEFLSKRIFGSFLAYIGSQSAFIAYLIFRRGYDEYRPNQFVCCI